MIELKFTEEELRIVIHALLFEAATEDEQVSVEYKDLLRYLFRKFNNVSITNTNKRPKL